MHCGAVRSYKFVAADHAEQCNQHSRKNRVIVDRKDYVDVTSYPQRIERRAQAVLKMDCQGALQLCEQSTPFVAQLIVGLIKRFAHALPIGMAELPQVLPVLGNRLLNELVAFFGSCRQMLSPGFLAYDSERSP